MLRLKVLNALSRKLKKKKKKNYEAFNFYYKIIKSKFEYINSK